MGQFNRIKSKIVSEPKLSILVCTVDVRVQTFLHAIINDLKEQIGLLPVQVLYLGDNFSMSVGEKRNLLKHMAKGEYITYIDDDDVVSPNYVKTICEAIKSNASVITFDGIEYYNGEHSYDFIFSRNNPKNWKDREKKIHHMVPNHLCVWRKDVADKEDFLHINKREDHEWGERMLKHIETEHHINDYLYHYYWSKKSSLTH